MPAPPAPELVVPDCGGSAFLRTTLADRLPGAEQARIFTDPPADTAELIERLRGADTILHYFQGRRLDAEVLAQTRPRRIVVMGPTGASVDAEAAAALGIELYETPGLAVPAVAEHTIALMLALARRLTRAHASMRAGAWEPRLSSELAGRRLGVVGIGRIGERVASIALAMGMEVSAWARQPGQRDDAVRLVSLDSLLRESDVVSLHARLGPESVGLIDRRRIGLLKPEALIVNTARAQLLDMDALRAALRAGKIAGAALDVFEAEPLSRDDPLREDPAVLLTPHSAWMTRQTLERFVCAAAAFISTGDRHAVARAG